MSITSISRPPPLLRRAPFLLLFAGLSAATGCTAEAVMTEEEPVATGEQPIYANTYAIWRSLSIPVCWEKPTAAQATKRAWVKEAVTETWQKNSKLAFTGWGTCTAQSKGIRINVDSRVEAYTENLGRFLDGMSAGLSLNFDFLGPENYVACAENYGEEACLRHTAVHEFGHALGFAHEQNRPDALVLPGCDEQGSDGNVRVGAYDLDSVLNYCNENLVPEVLSSGDTLGLRAFYGDPDAALYRKDAVRTDSGTAYFFFGSRYTRYDLNRGAMADLGTSVTYPRLTNKAWTGWPASWSSGSDAIVRDGTKLHFFRDRAYLTYDLRTDRVSTAARSVRGKWAGLPTSWSKVDAAIRWDATRTYLFRGSQYLRYDVPAHCVGGIDSCGRVAAGYPRPIAGNWPGVSWSSIDQVIDCGTNELCFFKNAEWLRYRKSGPEGVMAGYPAPIVGRWPGVTF